MYTGMLHTHTLSVMLFLLIYVIKTVLLLSNNTSTLQNFSKKIKVPEMIISTLFLVTGIFLAMMSGDLGTWFWVKIIAVATAIPIAIIGFKKLNKGLAVLSLLLIVYSYGISETKSPTFKRENKSAVYADGDKMILGKKVFEGECMGCHGVDGKAGLSGAKDLTLSQLKHDEKINSVMKGKNVMKGYEKILSPEQIEAVVTYVESLK